MRVLLDSHAWLWLLEGSHLNEETFQLCRTSATAGDLYLSPVSLWELGIKASRGTLDLPSPYREWFRLAIVRTRAKLAPFDLDVAGECAELPARFHGDPADRILAATCRVHGLVLLTRDKKLLELAKLGVLQAVRV